MARSAPQLHCQRLAVSLPVAVLPSTMGAFEFWLREDLLFVPTSTSVCSRSSLVVAYHTSCMRGLRASTSIRLVPEMGVLACRGNLLRHLNSQLWAIPCHIEPGTLMLTRQCPPSHLVVNPTVRTLLPSGRLSSLSRCVLFFLFFFCRGPRSQQCWSAFCSLFVPTLHSPFEIVRSTLSSIFLLPSNRPSVLVAHFFASPVAVSRTFTLVIRFFLPFHLRVCGCK